MPKRKALRYPSGVRPSSLRRQAVPLRAVQDPFFRERYQDYSSADIQDLLQEVFPRQVTSDQRPTLNAPWYQEPIEYPPLPEPPEFFRPRPTVVGDDTERLLANLQALVPGADLTRNLARLVPGMGLEPQKFIGMTTPSTGEVNIDPERGLEELLAHELQHLSRGQPPRILAGSELESERVEELVRELMQRRDRNIP